MKKDLIYLFTHSLGGKVQVFKEVELTVPPIEDPFFTDTTNAMSAMIKEAFPEAEIIEFSLESLMQCIEQEITTMRQTLGEDSLIVTPCTELASNKTQIIETNRIADYCGNNIGTGPRAGHDSIDNQIVKIVRNIYGHKTLFADDGSFSGETTVNQILDFRRYKHEFDAIVLGVATDKALEEIRKVFSGQIMVCQNIQGDLFEWIIEHDYWPWIPGSGRPIGKIDELTKLVTVAEINGMTFTIPYGLHKESLKEFASIEHEIIAERIIGFCFSKSIELFEILEELNHNIITFADFHGKNCSISVPVIIGQEPKPIDPNTRIIDHINEMSKIV